MTKTKKRKKIGLLDNLPRVPFMRKSEQVFADRRLRRKHTRSQKKSQLARELTAPDEA